ncbi:flagellar protein FlhB [Legionella antarctica]|uniref:Flagellar biosynthetic protein FlhB n=1 Tax=Legionella antarctica TaxID=2708020 RepID=A0A6F8T243_9GAMM|nr:EscU/YscU/HrcU family type III secretion system export apparatus switch protein [Legionella antarctica]BCA94293.1 flagellar protein FlhB [Legionella antarctica]
MKKKKSLAVALRYDGKGAPLVTAKGEGMIAKQIIATAKEHGIPLEQNEELTTLLSAVSINEEIPQPLYTAVAQILAFLYYVNGKQPKE